MHMCHYTMSKVFKFIWKCERYHMIWGYMNTGYGFTKRQAIMNSVKRYT